MIERQLEIATADGVMTTFEFHPDGAGPWPIIIYLMDAPSIRPALMTMANRMAASGYYVLMPFLYYRHSEFRQFGASDEELHHRRELMASVTREGALSDIKALLTHAQAQSVADSTRTIGAVGFCMSGPLVLAMAQNLGPSVGAIASVHGAWVVTDKPDSPHLQLDNISAEVYFAWADNDPTATARERDIMESALASAGVKHRIDFMAGAQHGFAPPGSERYNRVAAEKHWERVLDLFSRNLSSRAP